MVAGGGIIGTWHALELAEAGLLGRPPRGGGGTDGRVGAQLRTGLGQRPAFGRRARRGPARPPALGGGRHRGARHRVPPDGSLTIAGDAAARTVMEEFARGPDAAARAITFLEPDEVRACNPGRAGRRRGGAALRRGRGGRAPPGVGRPARPPVRRRTATRYRFHPRSPRRPRRAARARRHDGDPLGGRPRGPGHRRRLRPPARHRGAWRRACAGSGCRCCRRRRSPPR